MKKFALELNMVEPDGTQWHSALDAELKKNGIHALWDKEWLIVDTWNELQTAMDVLDRQQIEYEKWPVFHLPEPSSISPDFDGIGFALSDGSHYVFEELAAAYALDAGDRPDCDPVSAQLQLEEHVSASYSIGGSRRHVVSAHLRELVDRIASAYGCAVQWGWQ